MQAEETWRTGVKKFEDMNKALLAKLGWHMAAKSKLKWVEILSAKYCSREKFFEVKAKPHHSRCWQEICASRDFIKENSCFLIGNGENVNIFKDKWQLEGIKDS